MARTRLVAGNWKMHGSRAANRGLLDAVLKGLPESYKGSDAQCAVCAPFPYLGEVAAQLRGTPVAWGAQNVNEHAQGAYTGEVSAAMLVEFGCRYVIVGHSERRHIYGESDALVGAKFAAARGAGLTPILCVGETLTEREARRTEEVVARQLAAVEFGGAVLAYEPVWAIGTGRNATPAQAAEAHGHIRKRLQQWFGVQPAELCRIVYGGSVKPENIVDLASQPDVDGALVGGASLDVKAFSQIVSRSRKATV